MTTAWVVYEDTLPYTAKLVIICIEYDSVVSDKITYHIITDKITCPLTTFIIIFFLNVK